jgi:RND family efflux transporter MFP subunit
VQVAHAALRPMERVVHVVGTLAAYEQATVAAQVAGQIERMAVDLGDAVRAGQELALIDTTAYEALARQSAANLARAAAAASNAWQNFRRIESLRRDNIASESDLDQARAQALQAQADVKAADAADAIARLNLERSHVRAPFQGVIAARLANPGDYLTVGAPILRLVRTDPLRLRLEVPERESFAVASGQIVRVTVEGDSLVVTGRLARVAPVIREGDRMLVVEADVPNPGTLRAGVFVRVQIVVGDQEPGLSVPERAVTTFAGIEKVVGIENGRAAEKIVVTGRRGPGWVEIVSGLNPGEPVVLDPTGLRTGQPVSVQRVADVSSPPELPAANGQ